jgi:D-arabinose 1-dehydrogenase-like Zn-dependent alcohol dehydrogenase
LTPNIALILLPIGPDDVLIKLNATGICHSDLHFMMADWGVGKMSDYGTKCAGHEGAGVIVKVGANCKKLKPGMRAGFKPVADTCGTCEQCRTDKECYCGDAVLTGLHTDGKCYCTVNFVIGKSGCSGQANNRFLGTYKQYVKSPERYTTIIPEGVHDYIAGVSLKAPYCRIIN